MSVTVRDATREDIPQLAELKTLSARTAYQAAHAGPELEQWIAHSCGQAHFAYRIGRAGYHVLVAEQHGRIVGFATIRQRGTRADGNSGGLYVKPGLDGQGIGQALMTAREQRALKLGCTRMRVSCWRTNQRAQAFVAAQGFERTRAYREKTIGVLIDYFERDLTPAA